MRHETVLAAQSDRTRAEFGPKAKKMLKCDVISRQQCDGTGLSANGADGNIISSVGKKTEHILALTSWWCYREGECPDIVP